MTLLAAWHGLKAVVTQQAKPLAEPEPFYQKRPMTGFWSTLTDEQKKAALANDCEPNFGDFEKKSS